MDSSIHGSLYLKIRMNIPVWGWFQKKGTFAGSGNDPPRCLERLPAIEQLRANGATLADEKKTILIRPAGSYR
jgi:hypothetical protein